jgi:hypothetical protein
LDLDIVGHGHPLALDPMSLDFTGQGKQDNPIPVGFVCRWPAETLSWHGGGRGGAVCVQLLSCSPDGGPLVGMRRPRGIVLARALRSQNPAAWGRSFAGGVALVPRSRGG